MRISSLVYTTALCAGLTIAAPVFAGSAAEDWRQVAYSCDAGQELTVQFREEGSAVRVASPDRPEVKLIARPAKTGFRFGDSRHELRGDGEVVTWKVGNKTPVKCASQDPEALKLAAVAAN